MPNSGSKDQRKKTSGALAVGAGIFLSRIMGLVRERVFAHYLGSSDAAGAFRAALRIPNLLQNLFGEGALSASFIPVYSRMLADGRRDDAAKVAGTVFSFLLLMVAAVTVLGITAAGSLVDFLVPGFTLENKSLTVTLIKIMFPGIAFLVLSAWCLGILNSHRKFFLSYVAPVIWNISIIVALIAFGAGAALDSVGQFQLVEKVAWGVTIGSLLQFIVQLPSVLRLNQGVLISWIKKSKEVSKIIYAAGPAILARGVVQISAFVDQILSSFLGAQMVAVMAYAQTVYLLPVSLFGMAISAAELPELSGESGVTEASRSAIRERLQKAIDRLSFFIIPSAVGIITVGDAISGAIFVTGNFSASDTLLVWPVMGVMALGLFATTRARLFTSAFWALGDTKTPAVIAGVRVAVSAGVGLIVVFILKDALQLTNGQAAAALAGSTVCASWVEIFLVRFKLAQKIGSLEGNLKRTAKIWTVAMVAGIFSRSAMFLLYSVPVHSYTTLMISVITLSVFGGTYVLACRWIGISEADELIRKSLGRVFGKR